MAIRSVIFKQFSAFENAELGLSPGLNVFIGENATGKTHAMKAIYALTRGVSDEQSEPSDKLVRVFRPDDDSPGRLAHRGAGHKAASVKLVDDRGGSISVSINTKSGSAKSELKAFSPPPAVFLPSREGLAMFEGFIASYKRRELSFDETYFDLAESLSASALRGALPQALKQIGSDLEKALGGKVVLSGPRFYLRGEGGSMLEAPLVSEGLRKLGSILRLLQNGELRQTGLLLWDEPEANLNPRLTVLVAKVLLRLAQNDVQVVLATHDYLLVETLAQFTKQSCRFFAFRRTDGAASVEVSASETLDGLPFNPIRAEFLAHYDRLRGID